MIMFRRRILKNWSSASWNIFLCNKVIFFKYVYRKLLQVTVFFRGDINIFMQPLSHHSTTLRFEYYLHNHFRFCFQLFSWIILSLEHKNFNYLWRNKGNHRSNLSKICKICFKIWARRSFQPKNFTKTL